MIGRFIVPDRRAACPIEVGTVVDFEALAFRRRARGYVQNVTCEAIISHVALGPRRDVTRR